jgi:hypothetical protein
MQAARKIEALIGRHSLARYAPLLQLIYGLKFIIGAFFWIDAMQGAKAFSPEVWGAFAYSYPAWMWAGILMLCSGATLVGLIEPIHRRLVFVGSGAMIVNYIAITYSAFLTGGDPAVGLYASVLLLPLSIVVFAGAVSEWKT